MATVFHSGLLASPGCREIGGAQRSGTSAVLFHQRTSIGMSV
jgi:hypothetical protein